MSAKATYRTGIFLFYRWRIGLSALLLALSSAAVADGTMIRSAESSALYFFNPESNIDNYATLKTEFDTYLAPLGAYVFQPFNVRATFEQTLTEKSHGVYLLSSGHYGELKTRNALDAVLVGTSKGEYLQRKILSARDAADVTALKGAVIAGTGSEDYLKTLLRQMLGPEQRSLADSFRFLPTPKDIDALMAVSYGTAAAAISSESSLQKLAMINPKQHSQLKPLAQSEKTFLLVASIPRSFKQDGIPLIKILEDMGQQPVGVKNLKLLGLDGWKRVEALEAQYSTQLRAP
jgi:hypothetical protein